MSPDIKQMGKESRAKRNKVLSLACVCCEDSMCLTSRESWETSMK